MALNPNVVPATNFDLSSWKLQLPVDKLGTFAGKAAEVKSLGNYSHPDYFRTGGDGAMVFAAPVEGATTGGSIYARSELREMNGTANAEWNLEQGGYLSATLQVDVAPRHADGTYGKVVVGQIHGGDKQLVRLAWEDGTLFFANDITSSGKKDVHIELLNAAGQQPSVSLDETFSYSIEVRNDRLTVSVMADGQVYTSSSEINDAWNDNAFYFKAGAYLGVNENNGKGYGQVSMFALDVDHSNKPLLNRIFGDAGDDVLVGSAGDDVFAGGKGHNTLFGEAGFDTAVFDFALKSASSSYERGNVMVSGEGQSGQTSSVEQFQFTDRTVNLADGVPMIDDLFYLTRNIDVLDAGMESESHYAQYGWREGRDPNAFFDSSEYLRIYGDVAAAGMNPLEHYALYGWREGRDPSGAFDTDAYLSTYQDVAAAGMNPLEHYLNYGMYEGRESFADWLLA